MARICIAAGGTGGHIFPAAALAHVLKARGHTVHVLTDRRGQDFAQAFGDLPLTQISAGGLVGKSPLDKARAALRLLWGTAQSLIFMARQRPNLVIGFGGYPSVPPLMAAWALRIPSILHEQNAVMGLANRLASRFAQRVALSFDPTHGQVHAHKAQVIGNPVRADFADLPAYGQPTATGALELLVFGGSQGARILAETLPPALKGLPQDLRDRLHLNLQLRPEDQEQAKQTLKDCNLAGLRVEAFFNPIAEFMGQAHLVIARAGATTVCELALAGRPALFIPLALQADAQQAKNAQALVQVGAAISLDQNTLSPNTLQASLEDLLGQPDTLAAMATAAKTLARPRAAEDLADLAEDLIPEEIRP